MCCTRPWTWLLDTSLNICIFRIFANSEIVRRRKYSENFQIVCIFFETLRCKYFHLNLIFLSFVSEDCLRDHLQSRSTQANSRVMRMRRPPLARMLQRVAKVWSIRNVSVILPFFTTWTPKPSLRVSACIWCRNVIASALSLRLETNVCGISPGTWLLVTKMNCYRLEVGIVHGGWLHKMHRVSSVAFMFKDSTDFVLLWSFMSHAYGQSCNHSQ